MAGMTNFHIVAHGDLDRSPPAEDLSRLLDEHGVDHSPVPSLGPAWSGWTVFDCDQARFDTVVSPVLDAIVELGGYWRVTQEPRDDFEAQWFDSDGKHGFLDGLADLRSVNDGLVLQLDATEVQYLLDVLDYRATNFLDHMPSFHDEVPELEKMVRKLRALQAS